MDLESGEFGKLDDYEGDIGEAEYSPKSEFSKPKLVYDIFQKCIDSRAKEMKSGYFNTTFSVDGMPQKTWIGDTRKIYWSSVQALRRILFPEILSCEDASIKKKIKELVQSMDKLYSTYAYEEIKIINKNGKQECKKTGKTYMPEVDSTINVMSQFPDGTVILKRVYRGWNNNIDAYWNEMVIYSDKLLEELMKIVHSENYYKSKIRFG
jgi:hypothetical protein